MNLLDKVVNNKWIIALILSFLIFIAFFVYTNKKFKFFDKMTNISTANNDGNVTKNTNVPSTDKVQVSNHSDLLPLDTNSQWATLNPINSESVAIPDVLHSSGYHIGINSVGQSMKNPNLQGVGREDPVIPKLNSDGMFYQSSIDAR